MEEQSKLTPEEIAELRPDLDLADIRSLLIASGAAELTDQDLLKEVVEGAPEGVIGDILETEIREDG